MTSRRNFIFGAGATLAVIPAGVLMPVRSIAPLRSAPRFTAFLDETSLSFPYSNPYEDMGKAFADALVESMRIPIHLLYGGGSARMAHGSLQWHTLEELV